MVSQLSPIALELNCNVFSKYWDVLISVFPNLILQKSDVFFEKLIKKSNRDYNTDKYFQLIFILGMSSKWNKLKYRLIIS